MASNPHIALVGNPNSGKSSLFNALTGLNQKVGNFPGVTVDKKTGVCKLSAQKSLTIIDLPGTYSLYPKSADEQVTYEVLLNAKNEERPDLVVVVADASNLKRNLLFCSQIIDLRIPVVVALTMMDIAKNKGIQIDVEALQEAIGVPVVLINPRKNKGITLLKQTIDTQLSKASTPVKRVIDADALTCVWLREIEQFCATSSCYAALHIACNHQELSFLNAAQRIRLAALLDEVKFQKSKIQAEEILLRYQHINKIMALCVREITPAKRREYTEHIDKVLLHPIAGNAILLLVLFLLFQSIFWLANYPMQWVESLFAMLSTFLNQHMAANTFSDLIINGLVAGIGGIVIFIPQIMILFGFITLLEDTGYMARISFLTDRLMRSVGLNGRSVMPLISGMACAVPAIMSARTIQNKKERLITILVTPLMSCSARLPVYTILISLVIPNKTYLSIFNLQGLVLMALYLLGFVMALLVSKVLAIAIKVKERSYFLMEMPIYRAPRWSNVGITMIEKAKVFVLDAGKVILVISLFLWFLASYGPSESMHQLAQEKEFLLKQYPTQQDSIQHVMATKKLAHSYVGILGKTIEPLIQPLGFDWKIGIALITSFAAREVFVGTMATLYSVGEEVGTSTLEQKMQLATHANGSPVYTLASGVALLLFYVFAMQCMSTLAVVKRETQSWRYPIFQLFYMSAIAYATAWLAYTLLA